MSLCSVSNCKVQSDVKFHSPRNPQQLYLWKKILNIEEDKFYVCDAHFEEKFIRIRKLGITIDAYPSLFLGNIDPNSSETCQCCLKSFINESDEVHQISENLQSIFKEVMDCELQPGVICTECHENVVDFMNFRTTVRKKQEVREKRLKEKASTSSNLEISNVISQNPKQFKTESDGEGNQIDILEFEPEKISNFNDNFQSISNSSVINFIEHPNQIKNPDNKEIQEPEIKRPTIRTSSRIIKVKTEKPDENLTKIKEEPKDEEILNFNLPSSSFLEEVKMEPSDDNDLLSQMTTQNYTKKRSLVFDSSENENHLRIKRFNQGSSSYSSSLPSKIKIEPEILNFKSLKCQYCPDRFSTRDEILVHIQGNHNFKCSSCPAIFQYEITLIQHKMSEHAEQSSEQSGRMPVAYRHSCPVCKLKFSSAQSLSSHMKQKHKVELDDFAGLEKPKEKPKPSEKEAQKFPSLYSRSALVTVRKEVDKETLTKVHNNLNGIPCADCGLLYKPNKLEKHRMEKHNKH